MLCGHIYIAYCTNECAALLTINYKITNKKKKMHANNIHLIKLI
jgi:hypothetical protein